MVRRHILVLPRILLEIEQLPMLLLAHHGKPRIADAAPAKLLRRSAEILAQYQKQAGPLASLEARKSLFVAQSKSGALVVPAAVDYLTWTEAVDTFSAEPVPGAKTREVWLSGQASPKARAELQGRGWVVKERVLGP